MDLDNVAVSQLSIGETVTHAGVSAQVQDDGFTVAAWLEGDLRDPDQHMVTTPQGRHMIIITHPDTAAGLGLAASPEHGRVIGFIRVTAKIDVGKLDEGVPPEWTS